MRIIEKEMLAAIANKEDWKKDNTEVNFTDSGACGYSSILLHSNLIAVFNHASRVVDVVEETLERFPSNTTMSRLRALGVDVKRKGGKVFLYGEPL